MIVTIACEDPNTIVAVRRVGNGYIVSQHTAALATEATFGGQIGQMAYSTKEYVAETVEAVCSQVMKLYGGVLLEERKGI